MTAREATSAAQPAGRALLSGIGLPLVAGAVCVFGFAPFYAWPVPLVALAVLFAVWSGSGSARQAAISGFAFGLGYFLVGVSWVYVSLHEFGSMPAPLAALATFLFCAYLAIFPAMAGWLTVAGAGERPAIRLIAAPATFVVCEWLRGTLFTGFPWLTVGTSQAPSGPLSGFAAVFGAYGVSLAAASFAALLALALIRRSTRSRLAPIAAGVILVGVGAVAKQIHWTFPEGPPVSVALLQGNVAQEMKWREEVRAKTLEDYRRMVFEARARIVVLPETALPAFLDELPPEYVESLREHARTEGKEILLGTVERSFTGGTRDYYNSVVRITGEVQSYRKRHLVPFGEFIPPGFKWVLAILRIPMSDFAAGSRGQAGISAGGVRFGVAICYEDIFGEEVIDALPEAQAVLNVSNDAWFGESFAAEQHLQSSQIRAIETGRWVVRATNTGVTAAIDPAGRVVARLGAFTTGTIVADIVPRGGLTPYARWGNLPALAVALGLAGFAIHRRRAKRA